jgi:hypothetical protein
MAAGRPWVPVASHNLHFYMLNLAHLTVKWFRRFTPMFRKGTFFLFLSISALSLIINNQFALAQHGGGGGGMGGGSGGGSGAGRPGGVSEKDDLRSFHRAIALQATAQQSALFNTAIQDVENANAQLQAFRTAAQTVPPAPAATMHDLIDKVRSSNQSFLGSFSAAQKAGLKDVLKKLAKEDSELARQAQGFDQGLQSAKPTAEQLASAASLEKTLAGFQTQQLALATEMSIVVTPAGEETTFNLPALPNRLNIAGQSLAIPSSGVVVRTSKENGHNIFTLTLDADLFDLQQNITDVLSSGLNRSPNCGERVEIKQAVLAPAAPASLVTVHLHYERWICALGGGTASPTEAIASDGSLEVKLTPSMSRTNSQGSGLGLDSEIVRADSTGSLRNMLRSGDLGDNLRQQIAATILAVLRQATNPDSVLPASAKENLSLQKAQFQNAGSDKLSFRLNGELQFSDEQAKLFADQLKHRPSFKKTSAQETSAR